MEFTNELSRKTEDCLALFQNPLGPEKLADDDWFEDRAVDFLWWSHGLKAQKSGRSSLDYRLKDRPDIQKVVAGLLDTLETSLKKYLDADQESIRSKRDDSSSESDKSSSGSSWSEFSNEANESRGKDSATDDTKITDSDPKFYIETSLKMLARIAIAIRRSGTKLRYLKADEHLSTHSDDDEYIQLRSHLLFLILIGPYERGLFAELKRRVINKQIPIAVEIVVRSWIVDPSRATAIQKRLIEGNVIRRNRITFARRFVSKRATRLQGQETVVPAVNPPEPPKMVGTARAPSTYRADTQEPIPLQVPVQLEHGSLKPTETVTTNTLTATELGSQFVLPIIMPLEKKKGTLTIATKMTQTGAKQDYPACPTNKGSFECPYCVQILTEDYTTKSRWRGHVAQDLNPYSCIYEACPDSHTLFATKEEWAKHTTTRHNSARWVCDDCILENEQDDEFVFQSRERWEDHVRSIHNCSDNRLTLLRNLSKRTLTQMSVCPLCKRPDKASRPDEDDHIAEHLHAWALKALPWDLNPDDKVSSDPPEMGSDDDQAGMSEMSEAVDREEATVSDAIDREVNRLRTEFAVLSPQLAKLTYNLSQSIEKWNARTRLDAHNETMLWHLTSINQIGAQLSYALQTDLEENQFTTQQQQEIEASLCAHIELVIEYVNEVMMSRETGDEESFYPSHFPKVKGNKIPPAYDEIEGILRRARDDLPDTGGSTLSISWARYVLAWADITEKLRERRLKVQIASDNELATEALEIITLWASRLHPEALYYEGKWFELGQFGRKKDLEEAKIRYTQSVDGVFPRAGYRLGLILEQSGQLALALRYYEDAVTLGDSAACYSLALKELRSVDPEASKIENGLTLLHRSAESADSDAPQGAYTYGMVIARKLVDLPLDESLLPYDEKRAFSYIEKSAYLGFADGQLKMGQIFQYEELGYPKDLAKAFHYYHLAAIQGLPDAVSLMSEWLLSGLDDVLLPNMELSFKFAQWGAAKGHPNAEYVLGTHYNKGTYVGKNLREAKRWYNLALSHSFDPTFASTNAAALEKIVNITRQSEISGASREVDDRAYGPARISNSSFESTNEAAGEEVVNRIRMNQPVRRRRIEDGHNSRPERGLEARTIIIGIDLGALFLSVSWVDSSRPRETRQMPWYYANGDLETEGRIPTQYTQIEEWKKLASHGVSLRDATNASQGRGLSVFEDLCSSVIEVHTNAASFLTARLDHLWGVIVDPILYGTDYRVDELILSISVAFKLSCDGSARLRKAAWDAIARRNAIPMVQINLVGQMEANVMYTFMEQYQQEYSARGPSIALEDRDIVVICDCGGTGARALSYQVITKTPPLVQILTSWDSREYGNRSVDMAFISYLFKHRSSSLGTSKSASSQLDFFFRNDWEYGVKRSFTGDQKATLKLPRRAMSGLNRLRSSSQRLTLEPHTIRGFYSEPLSSIEGVVSSQLEALERLGTKPNSIVFVGGLAQSPYILRCLQSKFDTLFRLSKSTATIARGLVALDVQRFLYQTQPILAELEG